MKRNPYLKVKLKSLAAEAKIIRAEELKYKKAGRGNDPYRNGLYRHRIDVVRREARLTLLAYQFLRGIPYAACEKPRKENEIREPQLKYIAAMVKRFAGYVKIDYEVPVKEWLEGKKPAESLPVVRSASGFA